MKKGTKVTFTCYPAYEGKEEMTITLTSKPKIKRVSTILRNNYLEVLSGELYDFHRHATAIDESGGCYKVTWTLQDRKDLEVPVNDLDHSDIEVLKGAIKCL